MKRAHLVLLAALVASSSFAWIQKEDKSNISRAKQYVTRAESAIKRANGMLDKSTAQSAIESATTQFENASEMLTKAKEKLDSVSGSFAGRAEVESEYNLSKGRLDALDQRIKNANKEIASIDAVNKEGAAKDGPTVEAMSDLLPKLAGDIRGVNPDIERVRAWPQMKKDANSLIERYGKRGSRDGARNFFASVMDLKSGVESVDAAIQKFSTDGYKLIVQRSADLRKMVDNDVAQKNISQFGNAYPSTMQQILNQSEMYELFCKDLPGYDASVRQGALAAVKYTEESLRKLELEVIKSNTPPPDRYNGGDKAALSEQMKKWYTGRYPNGKIIKLIYPSDSWTRTTAWKWRNDGWYREDSSVLGVFVMVKGKDPAHVYLISCQFIKDHMANNQLSGLVPIGLEKPTANFILLASKVK
jgi:hypothetical protein